MLAHNFHIELDPAAPPVRVHFAFTTAPEDFAYTYANDWRIRTRDNGMRHGETLTGSRGVRVGFTTQPGFREL